MTPSEAFENLGSWSHDASTKKYWEALPKETGMSFKSILVALDGSDGGEAVLATAVAVGRAMSAHLEVFHVRADSKEAVPLLGEGMSGAMIEEMIDLADREADDRAKTARATYDTAIGQANIPVIESGPSDQGASASWHEETGREDEMVARYGRLADLIVAGRPRPDAERPSMLTLHAALFETGQPVLVAPPSAPSEIGRRVAISWNGSAEAACATNAALPFLTAADEVVILNVETDKAVSRVGADALERHLAWHGISARSERVSQGTAPVGETLLAESANCNADLLVMGAYTHSRVVQIILGGVTRYVLNNATIPLFMAH